MLSSFSPLPGASTRILSWLGSSHETVFGGASGHARQTVVETEQFPARHIALNSTRTEKDIKINPASTAPKNSPINNPISHYMFPDYPIQQNVKISYSLHRFSLDVQSLLGRRIKATKITNKTCLGPRTPSLIKNKP